MIVFVSGFASRAANPHRRFAPLGVIICGALLSPVAHAADRDICQMGDAANAGLGLAEIKPSNGIDLRKVEALCPDDSDRCKSRIHLAKRRLVFTTGRITGPYVCVYVAGSKTDVGGYVRQTDIEPRQMDRPLPLRAWKGNWRDFDNWIRLRVEGTALNAEGEAFWPSAHPSKKDSPGGPHTGDMSGVAMPHNNVVTFTSPEDPGGCRVIAALQRSQLVVSDNGNCGGENVSFSGVYER